MTRVDTYLLVRAASLYVAAILTVAVWLAKRPGPRAVSGALLGFFWNLPAVLLLNLSAQAFGWWRVDAEGGLLLGMPIELWLSWAWIWGAVPAVAFPSLPLGAVAAIALAFDLALMPLAAPVIRLGPAWLTGEAVGLVTSLVPGLLLARWTARGSHLTGRAVLQVITFTGAVLFLLPAVAITGSGTSWLNPLQRPVWQMSLWAQLLALPAVVGATAVQEFVTRGGGTPVPFDPPVRLVTTGVYAYVRNPMQLSAVVLLAMLGVFLRNPWVAAAGVMAHVYSAGLAGWDEHEDLQRRFGELWGAYATNVRPWIPRFRPWLPGTEPARLFVASTCGMCSEVGLWFMSRGASGLAIVPAETHASRSLTRITYEPADGSDAVTGVRAVARGLEHIHLGWALVAWALRLPGIVQLAQLLVDASGGEPRRIEGAHVSHTPPVVHHDRSLSGTVESAPALVSPDRPGRSRAAELHG